MPKKAKFAHKYIFVVGGVMSGVGKGVTASSIGTILQGKGFRVTAMKADPYLNVDAGTMNPTEHGEVFVLDSGLETDQDMGNYERFLNQSLPPENYMTNGSIFKHVIDKERALGYKGKCVEMVYHVTEEIIRRIKKSDEQTKSEITIFEIGGTIGEYQNAIFLEAARLLKRKNPRSVMFVMVSYLPVPKKLGEMKTKPTQNAVRQLNSYGINADMIIARSEFPLDVKRKEKIALATGVLMENVISAPDIESIYDVPINYEKESLGERVLQFFELKARKRDLADWRAMVAKRRNAKKEISIAVVGKYFDTGDFVLSDAYLSVIEAIKFSSFSQGAKPILIWINSKDYEINPRKVRELNNFDGVIMPGGFGETGVEGVITAIRFVREHKIPYLGLCYSMQLAVIEFARNVLGWKDAHTREIDPSSKHPVIDIMSEQRKNLKTKKFGGTMRLGTYPAIVRPDTIVEHAYATFGKGDYNRKKRLINERHRHRYEVNPDFIEELEAGGIVFSSTSPDVSLMETVELLKTKHPFFLGLQFHPEFKARPLAPHPLFSAFVEAILKRKK